MTEFPSPHPHRPEIAQRVVRWHNRNPLARRILATQVRHIGLLVLPFAALPAPGLNGPASGDAADDLATTSPAKTVVDAPAAEPAALPVAEPATEPPAEPDANSEPSEGVAVVFEEGPASDAPADAAMADTPAQSAAPAPMAPARRPTDDLDDEAPPSSAALAQALMPEPDAASPPPVASSPPDPQAQTADFDTPPALVTPAAQAMPDSGDAQPASEAAPAQQPGAAAAAIPWWRRLLPWRGRRNGAATPDALFTETLLPPWSPTQLARFAQDHGLAQRPEGDDWPERLAALDRDRQAQAADRGLTGRADRVLLTATIDDGLRRVRLVIGEGARPAIAGPRLWDHRRLAAVASTVLASGIGVAGVVGHRAGSAQAETALAAHSAAPAASAASASEVVLAQAQGVASAPTAEAASAPDLASASASASASAPTESEVAPSTASVAPAPPEPRAAHGAAPLADAGEAAAALPPADRRAADPQRSIAPDLRPRLSSATALAKVNAGDSARQGAPDAPQRAATATAPRGAPTATDARQPIAQDALPRFALVSDPIADRAQAQALLRRLRGEVERVHHPVAKEVSAHASPEGWRVSWWPFAARSQADNARAAMAGRGLSLEVVDF